MKCIRNQLMPPGTGPYCPGGTTYNDATGRCEGSATCPSGFRPDATGTCVAPTTSTCPPGFTPDTFGTCKAQPSLSNCPSGSTGINQQGQCTAPATEESCPSTSFTFDPTTGQCLDSSACPSG